MSRSPVKRDGHARVFRLAGMLLVPALITAIFVHGLPSGQWNAREELCQCAGYLASALVLATFAMKNMRLLRITAILSNIAFITYGALQWLPPVIGLHVLLLPINLVRLIELHRAERKGQPHQLSWAALVLLASQCIRPQNLRMHIQAAVSTQGARRALKSFYIGVTRIVKTRKSWPILHARPGSDPTP